MTAPAGVADGAETNRNVGPAANRDRLPRRGIAGRRAVADRADRQRIEQVRPGSTAAIVPPVPRGRTVPIVRTVRTVPPAWIVLPGRTVLSGRTVRTVPPAWIVPPGRTVPIVRTVRTVRAVRILIRIVPAGRTVLSAPTGQAGQASTVRDVHRGSAPTLIPPIGATATMVAPGAFTVGTGPRSFGRRTARPVPALTGLDPIRSEPTGTARPPGLQSAAPMAVATSAVGSTGMPAVPDPRGRPARPSPPPT